MAEGREKQPLRMVGYGRVSTGAEKQMDSLEHQILFFSEFARTRNFRLIQVYADEGISGKQLKRRDEFLRMLRDGEEGRFDVVVVKDVSRFARNTVDLLTSVRQLKARGINVMFVNNNQETLGESEFVLTLLGAMAQEESANLSKRIKFGKDITARRGRVPREILGYDKVNNFTLNINGEEADLVRRIYDMYRSGMYGMARIARVLEGEGIRTKRGCPYTEGYIRRILTSPIYCGELVNHKTTVLDFINGTKKALPEEEHYRHDRPELTIVSREAFEQVQQIRMERSRMMATKSGAPRRRHTSRYRLSGVVRCAECGRTMFRQNNTRPNGTVDSYWRCPLGTRRKNGPQCPNRAYLRNDILEKALSEALFACVGDEVSFAEAVRAHRTLAPDTGPSLEARRAEKQQTVERLMKQRKKCLEMYSGDVITMEELRRYTEEIGDKIERLKGDLAAMREDLEQPKTPQRDMEHCAVEVARFLRLESMENCDVKGFLSRIEVGADRTATFVFRVDPSGK